MHRWWKFWSVSSLFLSRSHFLSTTLTHSHTLTPSLSLSISFSLTFYLRWRRFCPISPNNTATRESYNIILFANGIIINVNTFKSCRGLTARCRVLRVNLCAYKTDKSNTPAVLWCSVHAILDIRGFGSKNCVYSTHTHTHKCTHVYPHSQQPHRRDKTRRATRLALHQSGGLGFGHIRFAFYELFVRFVFRNAFYRMWHILFRRDGLSLYLFLSIHLSISL